MQKRSDTDTIIAAMRILSREIQSGDGVANAAILEAAERLEELKTECEMLRKELDRKKWKVRNG